MSTNQTIEVRECINCKKTKELSDFSKRKYEKTGYSYQCKACRSTERYEGKAYFKERLRKHSIRTGRPLNYDIDPLYERWKATKNCAYCGVELSRQSGTANEGTFDHIYLDVNINDNLVICCRSCNSSKGKDHVYDFYQRSDKFTDELLDALASEMARRMLRKEPTRQYVERVKAGFKLESDELKGDE